MFLQTMKFVIEHTRGERARLGRLLEVGCHGNVTIETPMCLLFTRGGKNMLARTQRNLQNGMYPVKT